MKRRQAGSLQLVRRRRVVVVFVRRVVLRNKPEDEFCHTPRACKAYEALDVIKSCDLSFEWPVDVLNRARARARALALNWFARMSAAIAQA